MEVKHTFINQLFELCVDWRLTIEKMSKMVSRDDRTISYSQELVAFIIFHSFERKTIQNIHLQNFYFRITPEVYLGHLFLLSIMMF